MSDLTFWLEAAIWETFKDKVDSRRLLGVLAVYFMKLFQIVR